MKSPGTIPVVQRPGPHWEPVPHTVLRDEKLAQTLHSSGYAVVPFLEPEALAQLRDIYTREHQLNFDKGGMFYSVYSQDKAYRKRIHDEIQAIMKPSFDRFFHNYKNVVNFFVSKLPGPASEFSIHQDMTAVDERKFSPLSVWTPLVDITEENGALCVMPYSQWFFSPWRGISFRFPFQDILSTVRRYLIPVTLKAGEAIIFDPRILHNSLPNSSETDRPAIVSGIFPPESEFVTCYREPGENQKIELLKHPESWILEYENFLQNCHIRPPHGELIGHADFEFPAVSKEAFIANCESNGIFPADRIPEAVEEHCNMIGEPDGSDPAVQGAKPGGNGQPEPEMQLGFFQKLKSVFSR